MLGFLMVFGLFLTARVYSFSFSLLVGRSSNSSNSVPSPYVLGFLGLRNWCGTTAGIPLVVQRLEADECSSCMMDGLAFSRLAIVGIVSRLFPPGVLVVVGGPGEQAFIRALSVELRLELTDVLRSGKPEVAPDVPMCLFMDARVGSA